MEEKEGCVDRGAFESAIDDFVASSVRQTIINDELYEKILRVKTKEGQDPDVPKKLRDWINSRFAVDADGETVIVLSGKAKKRREVVKRSRIYDLINEAHTAKTNHAGINTVSSMINKEYIYVPRVVIDKFIQMCPHCSGKRTPTRSSIGGGKRLLHAAQSRPFSTTSDQFTVNVVATPAPVREAFGDEGEPGVLVVFSQTHKLVWLEALRCIDGRTIAAGLLRVFSRTSVPVTCQMHVDPLHRIEVEQALRKMGVPAMSEPPIKRDVLQIEQEALIPQVTGKLEAIAAAWAKVPEKERKPLRWDYFISAIENELCAAVGAERPYVALQYFKRAMKPLPDGVPAVLVDPAVAQSVHVAQTLTGLPAVSDNFSTFEDVLTTTPLFDPKFVETNAPPKT